MKTALFLGAGASVFAGMPITKRLASEVLDHTRRENWENSDMKRLATNIGEAYREKDAEMLYHAICTMIAAERQHQTTVEYKTKVAGYAKPTREIRTTAAYNRGNVTVKNETVDIDETIRALESLEASIRNILLTSLMVKPKYLDTVVSIYDKLFKFASHNVITTNYDNVLEAYCERVGLDLTNGFKGSPLGDKRIWSDMWESNKNALHLIKLHGSITWQKDDDDTVLEIGRPGLREANRDVMVAPTLGEKDYDGDIFPALMNRFKTVLAETEMLIVVGFSFRDPTINRILLNRLKRTDENPRPMRLLYVDPKLTGLKEWIGSNAETSEVRMPQKGVLRGFSQDGMPYVYAYQGEFNQGTVEFIEFVLDAYENGAL